MISIEMVRENPIWFDHELAKRNINPIANQIIDLDGAVRDHLTKSQNLNHRKNDIAKAIANLKKTKSPVPDDLIVEANSIKDLIPQTKEMVDKFYAELNTLISGIPNLPDHTTPFGTSSSDNIVVRKYGTPTELQNPLPHDDLGVNLGLMDFDSAAALSGSRFVYLYGDLAKLERSLAHFMLDLHTKEHKFLEVNPPLLVKNTALFGTGQLPKFESELFKTGDHYLIPTAEVSLTNIVANKIVKLDQLPIRYTAVTPCFRAEAGAYGQDTKGMIRQHQFEKVELVSITKPENSSEELEYITHCAERVLQRLMLPYRTMLLCTGDMGFSAAKTYDIEVWLPSQNTYREISSCSNCKDFQARRMMARYKNGKRNDYVHTLNGSGVAIGRCLIAIMENYQQPDGSIVIPKVLQHYMGKSVITKIG